MDFFITLSSGPTPNLPYNTPSHSKYFFDKPVELDGDYEVALVQTVFKDVHSPRLANIKIYPDSTTNDEFVFSLEGLEGESFDSIVRNLNNNIWMKFHSYTYRKKNSSMENDSNLDYNEIPVVKYDSKFSIFYVKLPKDWTYKIVDIDKNYIEMLDENTFKFNGSNFYFLKHFYVLTNLIDDQLTGDEEMSILKNFVFEKISSNVTSKEFVNPQYIKVKRNFISDLSLEYTPDLMKGSFLKGSIISTLHFRKINGF